MLKVITVAEALELQKKEFDKKMPVRKLPLSGSLGKVLAEDVKASEYVPEFNRSLVDGYAVRAEDTFGCSESIPALLKLTGEVKMGEPAGMSLSPGECVYVPTGGAVPDGADACVMIEYAEVFKDGLICVNKSAAPGANIIFKGDDTAPGKVIIRQGKRLSARDMGVLAALGNTQVNVRREPVIGIISTGDELVSPDVRPGPGQIRDINTSLLEGLCRESGALPLEYGIIKDDEELLSDTVRKAVSECDMVLISGGSSVGVKDATFKVIEKQGEILFHGLAVKPGKPTMLGKISGKPVFGLPGHPQAVFFIAYLLVRPMIAHIMEAETREHYAEAVITEAVSANHGREQYMGVSLSRKEGELFARPVRSKSGLISSIAEADGFFAVARDSEGVSKGEKITVCLFD